MNNQSQSQSDWKTRVLKEASDLQDKLDKLNSFLAGQKFKEMAESPNQNEKTMSRLLVEQQTHMKAYFDVLHARLNLIQ